MRKDKIRKLITRLQAYPELYDQSCWGMKKAGCSAVCCLAGHTVAMEGYCLLYDRTVLGEIAGFRTATRCYRKGGKRTFSIHNVARRILGLDNPDAFVLFDALAMDWRHQEEFDDAITPQEVTAVAVKELEDLMRLGSYSATTVIESVTEEEPSNSIQTEDEVIAAAL